MSDDLITSFSQLSPSGESKVSAEGFVGEVSQGPEFNRVIAQENKKLLAAQSSVTDNKIEELELHEEVSQPAGSPGEATSGQHLAVGSRASGNTLPNLSLHNGALAVGRLIYTADTVAVTNESLSRFMERQGLVNDRLRSESPAQATNFNEHNQFGAKAVFPPNSSELDKALLADEQSLEATRPTVDDSLEIPRGNGFQSSPQTADSIDAAGSVPFGSNAISQLAVKQMINIRGSAPSNTSVTPGQDISPIETNKPGLALYEGDGALSVVSEKQITGKSNSAAAESGDESEKVARFTPIIQKNHGPSESSAQWRVNPELKISEFSGQSESLGKETGEVVGKKMDHQTQDQINSLKLEANRDFELARLQSDSNKLQASGQDKSQLGLMNAIDNHENSLKAYRDVSQTAERDALHNEPGLNRVEFKGALKDAQRMVASNTYNNLTDSYENWSSKFGEILAQRIAGHVSKENWNIQLRLNPASLGEISLQIELSEKGLEGRFGSNEESTRQLLQDTLPKLRLALRDLLDENQGLSFDVSDFGYSSNDREDQSEKNASSEIVEEINFETEVLLGRTLDARLSSVVGLDILV